MRLAEWSQSYQMWSCNGQITFSSVAAKLGLIVGASFKASDLVSRFFTWIGLTGEFSRCERSWEISFLRRKCKKSLH